MVVMRAVSANRAATHTTDVAFAEDGQEVRNMASV
jgi:hypothetical protein